MGTNLILIFTILSVFTNCKYKSVLSNNNVVGKLKLLCISAKLFIFT